MCMLVCVIFFHYDRHETDAIMVTPGTAPNAVSIYNHDYHQVPVGSKSVSTKTANFSLFTTMADDLDRAQLECYRAETRLNVEPPTDVQVRLSPEILNFIQEQGQVSESTHRRW